MNDRINIIKAVLLNALRHSEIAESNFELK